MSMTATQRIHDQGSVASLRKHVPGRKMSARYTTRPPSRMPEFEMIKPPSQHADVFVTVIEAPAPAPATTTEAEAPAVPAAASTPAPKRVRPHPPPLSIPKKPQGPPLPVLPVPLIPPVSKPMIQSTPDPKSENSDTKVLPGPPPPPTVQTSQPDEPTTAETPVMRSMFPTYNTSIPLAQQVYKPNADHVPPPTESMTASRLSSNNPFRKVVEPVQEPVLAPAESETRATPLRRSESLKRPATIATAEELLGLWDVANGQGYDAAADQYVLELSCDDLTPDREVINFGTNSMNMYTLATSKPTIRTSRAHPLQYATRISISTSVLETPSRQDPLICSIFPKMAGLMALDQSSSEAISRGLSRSASDLLQKQAVESAQEKEGSMLLWDADSDRYCILHPTLLDNGATTLPIDITPSAEAPERIVIYAPETRTPLLSLDMQSLSLTIHARTITALPSLYILDTLMVALLSLLLHLHRLCASPRVQLSGIASASAEAVEVADSKDVGAVPTLYFPPPPSSVVSNGSRRQQQQQGQRQKNRSHSSPRLHSSWFHQHHSNRSTTMTAATTGPLTPHSVFTSPTPSHSHQWPSNINNSNYNPDLDIELGHLSSRDGTLVPSSPHPSSQSTSNKASSKWKAIIWPSKSPATPNPKQKPPKGLFSADDQTLPAGTRATLRFVYWIFGALYWILGLLIQILVAGVVAGGKLVTKL